MTGAPLPTDFVVIIDNSKSITPPEQVLIRETTMLIADLADPGDRVSVITFGQDARLVASAQIQSDADRTGFKRDVRARVDFAENYSDIRKGIRVLAQNRDKLFRGKGQSVRAVILLSDGKLEPANRQTREAVLEMQADLREALSDTEIQAVVLGDTTSRDPILQLDSRNINGQVLMREYIARSPDRFFHAKSLDQILDVAVAILHKAKGISSLGQEGQAEFRIDDTVESMSFIVRKRATDGKTICQSSDIALRWPGGEPVTLAKRGSLTGDVLYWSADYQYFDLVVVRKPPKGLWSIALQNGATPQVLSKINTPIELRFSARDHYFLNEADTLTAWLFNRRSGEVSKAPYEIQAHVGTDGALAASNVYIPLRAQGETGQYTLAVPGDLTAGLKRERARGTIALELIARRRETPGSPQLDAWFIRRSAAMRIEMVEPFIHWKMQESQLTQIPLRSVVLTYGGEENVPRVDPAAPAQPYHPVFDAPPRLTVSVERFDEKTKGYTPEGRKTMEGRPEQHTRVYRADHPLPQTGTYRYAYQLEGTTKQGRFVMVSPWYGFTARYCWECVGGALAAMLLLAYWHSAWSATLRGQILARVVGGAVASIPVRPTRSFTSTAIASLNQPNAPRFTLRAWRLFYVLRKRVTLTMLSGEATLDRQRIAGGQSISVSPYGKHTLKLTKADGSVVEVEMTLRV
jgi:hypothetical protein